MKPPTLGKTTSRHARLTELFCAAIHLGREEREQFLAEKCAHDESMRLEVKALLESPQDEPGFLDRHFDTQAQVAHPNKLNFSPDDAEFDHSEPLESGRQDLSAGPDLGHLLEDWSRFSLQEKLGGGRSSLVYRAVDKQLGRSVAVKFLTSFSDSQLTRFQREAEALARVAHDNVLKLYETGSVKGIPFLVTPWIPNPDLLCSTAELTLSEKVSLILKVTRGLEAAHGLGIVHRDIKPSNILVEHLDDGSLRPLIADFGIAHSHWSSHLTATGMLVGTPGYLPPERIFPTPNSDPTQERRSDPRGDIYSLGVTAYQMLLGKHPFADHDPITMGPSGRPEAILDPRQINPDFPSSLAGLLFRCLATDPQQRYPSARALAADLERFLAHRPLSESARTALDPKPAKAQSRVERRRTIVAATAILLGLLAVVLVLHSLWFGDQTAADKSQVAAPVHSLGQTFMRRLGTSGLLIGSTFEVLTDDSSSAKNRSIEIGDSSAPKPREPSQMFDLGMRALRQFETLKARVFLEAAIESAPQDPVPHWALAAALNSLGYDNSALQAAERAFELSGSSSLRLRLEIEARYRQLRGEREASLALFQNLKDLYPADLEIGLQLARIQLQLGDAQGARKVLEQVRPFHPQTPRLTLLQAEVAMALAELPQALERLTAAATQGQALDAPLIVARSELKKAHTLGRMDDAKGSLAAAERAKAILSPAGDLQGTAEALTLASTSSHALGLNSEALARAQEAFGIFREIGYRVGMARALNRIAITTFRIDGDRGAFYQRQEEALAIYRQAGSLLGIGTTLNNLGLISSFDGNFALARQQFAQAIEAQEKIGDREGLARTLGNLGIAKLGELDLAAAKQAQQRALKLREDSYDIGGVATSALNLGHIHRLSGELETALDFYQRTLEIGQQIGSSNLVARASRGTGRVYLQRGELEAARRRLEAAIQARGPAGDKGTGFAGVFLARLLLDQGQAAPAEEMARGALHGSAESWAAAIRGQALVALGRRDEAREALNQSRRTINDSNSPGILEARIDQCRLSFRLDGRTDGSCHDRLHETLSTAEGADLKIITGEARLALAEIGLGSEESPIETLNELRALRDRARGQGLHWLASRAERLHSVHSWPAAEPEAESNG